MYNNCKNFYYAVCIMQKGLAEYCAKQEKFFFLKKFSPCSRRHAEMLSATKRALCGKRGSWKVPGDFYFVLSGESGSFARRGAPRHNAARPEASGKTTLFRETTGRMF